MARDYSTDRDKDSPGYYIAPFQPVSLAPVDEAARNRLDSLCQTAAPAAFVPFRAYVGTDQFALS